VRDEFISGLLEIARRDRNVLLLTADLGFGVLDEYRRELPDQFINVGIAEQNMIGIATGLAMEGNIVYCYSIGNFPTLRCLEQIRNDAAYHQANVKIVSIGGGFSYGQLGMSHHATEDLAIMRALPEVKVVVPGTRNEAKAAANYLYQTPGVQYLRLDKSYATDQVEPHEIDLSEWNVLRKAQEVTIISTGGVLEEVIEAADMLSQRGVEVGMISARNLTPHDFKSILEMFAGSKLLISVEEHVRSGGLGGLVAEIVSESELKIRLIRLGVLPRNISTVGSQKYLRNLNGLTAQKLVELVLSNRITH
jgi:transketolase